MTVDPRRVSDGSLNLEGGIDSGRAPNLLAPNQAAFAINTTFRGGWAHPRPGLRRITLSFPNEDTEALFKDTLFQDAGDYVSDAGDGSLISMHGGRVFRVSLTSGYQFQVQDISIPGDYNPSNRTSAWTTQAENYFIINDGQTLPYIFNGASARRAKEREIPVSRQIVYYMGRIWVAFGRFYIAGDIVFGEGNRSDILKFTENDYYNEGGSFAVPANYGEITGFYPLPTLDTVIGQGELAVFAQDGVFLNQVPQDRATWKSTKTPLQRVIELANGATSQDSIVAVNSDLYYRSNDGIRSLIAAVRNFGDGPGNTPISSELNRILLQDPDEFLNFCSAVRFNNRLLTTSSPGLRQGHGTYHRCLAVLDFDLITSMRNRTAPAWEGIWTGLNILKVVTVKHKKVPRCFVYALNDSDEIEIWELTKDDKFDNDTSRIEWSIESRSMDFQTKFDQKNLNSGDIFIDQLTGTVDIDMDFRPDSHPCWIDWDNWQECAKYKFCVDDFGTCPTLPNYKEQYRAKHQLTQPPDTFDPVTREQYRTFFELETRLKITGYCRLKQQRYNAYVMEEAPYARNL
jgi:hypothetical protein